MSNHDEHRAEHADNDSLESVSDFERVLKLIATQVEDSERRQTQILEQLSGRLEKIETGSQASVENISQTDEPALDRVESSLARLAEQMAGPPIQQVANSDVIPETNVAQGTSDWSGAIGRQPEQDTPNESSNSPETSGFAQPINFAERDVWADNAADLGPELNDSPDGHKSDADINEPDAQPEAPAHSSPPATHVMSAAQGNKTGFTNDPWSNDDAERLMQIYEREMFQSHDQPKEAASIAPAPIAVEQEPQMAVPQVEEVQAFAPAFPAPPQPAALDDDREWLDDRFAQIAVRVEQAIMEMRAEDPVSALREHFTQFQDDMVGALNDVATRADIEGLKTAEAQIDDLRTHFERVQDQLGRLDVVEKQLEAIMDRLSDDRLVTLLAGNSANPANQSELAAVVGEYVANRVTDAQPNTAHVDDKLSRMQDSLTAYIEEQRAGADQQMGVLDTLQDAMVQVLDRIETLDAPAPHAQQQFVANEAFIEAAPAPAPADQYESNEPQHEEYVEQQQESEFEPEAEAAEAPVSEYQETEAHDSESFIPADDLATMSSSAIGAATAATQRHPDIEPFSSDVATSNPENAAPAAVRYDLQDHATEAAPEPVDASLSSQVAEQTLDGYNEPAAQMGELAVNQPSVARAPQAAPASHPGNDIARMREEFIAEAQRAKVQADADAAANALNPPPKKGFTLFGVSLPGGSASKANPSSNTAAVADPYPAQGETKIFGMSRKVVLLGAIGLMIAASGVLLLMPRSAPVPPQNNTIERVVPQNLSTTPAPQPQRALPQSGADKVPSKPEGAPIDGGVGDRSEIIEPWSRTLGSLPETGRASVSNLSGIALQTRATPATQADLDHLANQQSMAHWSLKLGDAAGNATPADLLPEYQGSIATASIAQPGLVQKAAHHAIQSIPQATLTKKRSQLDLPPPTVGPLSLRLAAAKGDPSAEFEVGSRLAAGKGTGQDFKKAVKWYTRSASRGFIQSQYRLGTFYERGLGVKKDVSRARIWYRRAAEQGNTKAMHNLAVLSAGQTTGAPDYASAANWFARAAEHGLADSQFNLGVLYENGLGVKKDLKEAYMFYALAARSGDKDSVKRRDALKSSLSVDDLASAEAMVSGWRRKTVSKLANDAFTAGQAWKSGATSSYSN